MRIFEHWLLSLLIVIPCVNTAWSQVWISTEGPPTLNVRFLANNSRGHIFAGSADGMVYRTTDTGGEWTIHGDGLTFGIPVTAIAIDINDHIYLCQNGAGLFKSTDNGTTYFRIADTLPSTRIVYVAQRSSLGQPTTLFIGIDDPAKRLLLLLLSTDAGESWQQIPLPNNQVQSIKETSLSPNSDKLFVSVGYNKGFYQYTTVGTAKRWVRIDGTNIPSGESDDNFLTIRFNKRGEIFLGRNALPSSTYCKNACVLRSSDDGMSWKYLLNGWDTTDVQENRISGIGFAMDSIVYVTTQKSGTWRSTDNGDTWALAIDSLPGRGHGSTLTGDGNGRIFLAPIGRFVHKVSEIPTSVSEAGGRFSDDGLIAPNPVKDIIRATVSGCSGPNARVTLVNSIGEVTNVEFMMENVGDDLQLTASSYSLSSGVYRLIVYSGSRIWSFPVVIGR